EVVGDPARLGQIDFATLLDPDVVIRVDASAAPEAGPVEAVRIFSSAISRISARPGAPLMVSCASTKPLSSGSRGGSCRAQTVSRCIVALECMRDLTARVSGRLLLRGLRDEMPEVPS